MLVAGCVLALATVVGCGSESGDDAESAPPAREVKKAIAWINPLGDGEMAGSAIFIHEGSQITLQVSVEQAPPGEHAVHIHEFGDCSAPDGSSAGGHWNPTEEDHGKWGDAPHHLGDIGNLTVGEDGKAALTLTTDRWSMGSGETNDILEKSVIVHASADDFTTQPTGAAGGRIGCGVIRAQ
jgi:Cu-Zn family superoxide dismutase